VHRWNKAQQDALLPQVESGMLTLIGATTENPYLRSSVLWFHVLGFFELNPLTEAHLNQILDRALTDKDSGFGNRKSW